VNPSSLEVVDSRPWARRRKCIYVSGVLLFLAALFGMFYALVLYRAPTCFDGRQNGAETGVDCGGGCARVCSITIQEPTVRWARAFKVVDSTYNVVGYVENRNSDAGVENIPYTFTLYDQLGAVITKVSGTTTLPPSNVYAIFEDRVTVPIGQTPIKTVLSFDTNVPWVTMEKGKELFDVHSKQLSNTDVKPRLDARITNTTLDVREQVEAVATIFDAAGTPLTASRTIVPKFNPREDRIVTFTWPEPIATTIRSCTVPTDVVLAIDLSGSINDDGGTPPEPLETVLRAASGFASRLKNEDQIGVVTFATHAYIVEQLSNNRGRIAEEIRNLVVEPKEERGSTNTGDGLKAAIVELISEHHNPNARKVAVLLTDGIANAPQPKTAETYAQELAGQARALGIEVFTVGLGSKVRADFLRSLATDNAHSYTTVDKASLDQIYASISEALCEEGAAVIEIITKTNAQ
jgi:Mg-chelatase subunit ChlD